MKTFFTLFVYLSVNMLWAQTDSTKTVPVEEEEDYSQYADAEAPEGSKSYCTSKVLGLSPQKLISVGYDVQGPYSLNSGAYAAYLQEKSQIDYSHGTRLLANFPVISNTRWLVNLGANYMESAYAMGGSVSHPLASTLKNNGLRTMGVNVTLFKPLNSKYFVLSQLSTDWNGDIPYFNLPAMNQLKVSAVAAFGFKKHDRSIFALGISRTYRGGGLLYIPVLMFNYTYPNRKWGYEILLPAKALVRYTVNSRNMIFAGFELEGAAYRLNNMMKDYPSQYNALELKRSEIRTRLSYEFSLYKFIWVSINTGYRLNYRFAVDNGDKYRSFFDDTPYIIENELANAFYANVSINLVAP